MAGNQFKRKLRNCWIDILTRDTFLCSKQACLVFVSICLRSTPQAKNGKDWLIVVLGIEPTAFALSYISSQTRIRDFPAAASCSFGIMDLHYQVQLSFYIFK